MLILLEFLFFIDLLLVKKLLLNKIFKIRYHSKENIERALIKNMNNINQACQPLLKKISSFDQKNQ